MKGNLSKIHDPLLSFTGPNLTQTLSQIEKGVQGISAANYPKFLIGAQANGEALAAAAALKRLAGQINVTIHALGILMCLLHILEPDEIVESVSLGAGNTGRKFDLETNKRIAEFKFIQWRGGAETIRQNAVFKDYFLLEEHLTKKQKSLYLLGTAHALRFLKGGRSMASVLSRNEPLQRRFSLRFGDKFGTVGEYYAAHNSAVEIKGVSPWLTELAKNAIAEPDSSVE